MNQLENPKNKFSGQQVENFIGAVAYINRTVPHSKKIPYHANT